MEKVTTYFEISPDAEVAYDTETGENAVAYVKVSTEHKTKLSPDLIKQVHLGHAGMVSAQLDIPVRYLRIITEEEYNANSDDGDDTQGEEVAKHDLAKQVQEDMDWRLRQEG